jgi:hypothetical protein
LSAVAFFGVGPTLAQTSRNIEEVGRITLPPIPPESPPGLVSDLWTASGFAYVGRYRDLPLRVEVYNANTPTTPSFVCSPTETATGAEVEDVVVEGQYLFMAVQDDDADINGVRVHDLVDLAAPICAGAGTFIPTIPSAHNLFFYDHSNGTRMLIVATMMPDALMGVHLVDADVTAAPVPIHFIPHPLPPEAYCVPAPGRPCGPHDIYAQQVGGRDLLVIAALSDGVYIYDITVPTAPVKLSHFNYFWRTPDIDGDGVSDCCDVFGDGLCDDTNFDLTIDDLDKTFLSNTHDARITLDGQYIWTGDEKACGAHVITWSLADAVTLCADIDGCPAAAGEMVPTGEFYLNAAMPVVVHQIRWYSENYAFVPWYEEGLRVLGNTNDPTLVPNPAAAPIEVGYLDSLVPNTDGCIENGAPGAACTGPIRVLNAGFFGDWGVSWDNCYLYIADRGSPDNNEAPPEDAGSPGALIVMRYTGGPTTPQPLRITKNPLVPGELVASWGEVPFASSFNIYRGTIPMAGGMATRPVGSEYDHTRIDLATCNVFGNSQVLATQFTPLGAICNNAVDDDLDTFIDCTDTVAGTENCAADQSCQPFAYYYIVTARSPCDDAADREGNYGQDSFGVNRPVASSTCPL